MKAAIYDEEAKEGKFFLRLVPGIGGVALRLVDDNGDRISDLLIVYHDGSAFLCPDVMSNAGLKLDDRRRLQLQ